jgi:hypothetical protein
MTMIDPFSPAFEDYPYDPHPGSPGDLYDPQEFVPLPDVFDPNDWRTDTVATPDKPATSAANTPAGADRLAALVEHLAALERAYLAEEPPDGSIILVDEDIAYVRTDPPPGEPLRRLAWGAEVGDWYRLDGADSHARPKALGEILGLDDPPCDRKPHSFEVLYTAADIARLAEQFTRDGTG